MTQVHQEANCCLVWDCGFSTFCITHEMPVSQIQLRSPPRCTTMNSREQTLVTHDLLLGLLLSEAEKSTEPCGGCFCIGIVNIL